MAINPVNYENILSVKSPEATLFCILAASAPPTSPQYFK